ncbi:MAG TPA: sigma-54 dependent transcriptional regulator [Myxococcaceae bacterium]|nr:sigma-54 dependent transcriptional regulator [Myxococcaceae bacterium]
MDRMAVLVVDDEESVRVYLQELLAQSGYLARSASTGAQALEMLAAGSFDAVLLDVVMPEVSGLEVLRRYREGGGAAPVIVLSALAGADDAVRAMKLGATDYLSKPFDQVELETTLRRALGGAPQAPVPTVPLVARPPPELALEPPPPADDRDSRPIIFTSAAMRKANALLERISDTDVPVLLLGESGTGKEVFAREVHALSRRRPRPFIKVNCAALPAELLESELFGHEKGAFTGATAEKPGKFELADQGTIFLDEIGEMAIRLQAKLLQVLQDEEFFRVGGKRSVRVDSRVVVATNRDLEKEIQEGAFREDLFYRLNVVAIRLPPLRERKEDIIPLVEHFLRKYGKRYRRAQAELPQEVLAAFLDHAWPGNVRELENMVRRLVVLKDPSMVLEELRAAPRATQELNQVVVPVNTALLPAPAVAPAAPPAAPRPPELELSLKDIGKRAAMVAEREAILAMLQRTGWNKRRAAAKLKISYKALLYKIKDTGIVDPRANAEL